MATKNIVPNADTEGQLGTSTKGWGKIFLGGAAANIDVNNVSGTNTAGKSLTLISGASTGSGAGGSIVFQTAAAGGSGTSVNSHATVLTLDSAKLATFTGGLDIAGAVDIAGDLTLSAGADGALNFSAASSIKILDNSATSLVIEEADTAYMTFVTTNSSEAIKFDKALDINAAVQLDSTLTVGVNDTGYDVKFFGATSGKSLLWDESEDSLIVTGTTDLIGTTNLDIVDIDGAVNMATTALVTGVLTTTATQVANGGITSGSNIVSDTDSTDDLGTTSVRWANLFVDGITATDQITATGFTGTLDGILGSGAAAAATVTTLNTSGVVNLNLTTDSSSSTSGALIVDGGVGIAAKLFVGTDLDVDGTTNLDIVDIDGAVNIGAEVTLADANKIIFNDASQFIHASSDAILNLGGGDEIDITSPTIDVNASTSVLVTTPDFKIDSSGSDDPLLTLKTTHTNKNNSSVLKFLKDAANIENGEIIGKIEFYADDDGANETLYSKIQAETSVTTNGQEGGKLSLMVASNDAEMITGLLLQDGNAEDEIDVTIGSGTSSVTTIAGNIKIPDAGTIGSASDADALKIEADGVVISTQGIEFEGTALATGQSGISSSGNGGEIRIYTNGNQAFTFGASGSGGDLTIAEGKIRADNGSSQGQLILATSKPLSTGSGDGLVAGNTIGEIVFQHDLTTADGAVIAAVADETTASGEQHHGARLEFYTAANGDNTSNPVKRTTIGNDGVLTQNGALRLGTGTTGAEAVADDFIIEPGLASVGMSIISTTAGQGQISFGDTDDTDIGAILYVHGNDNEMIFRAGTTNIMSLKSGNVLISSTTGEFHVGHDGSALAGNGADRDGVSLTGDGTFTVHKDGNPPVSIGRAQDGKLVKFFGATTEQGDITLSGSTVAFNGFQGCHESSGISNNIDIGTVVSTIDELDTNLDGSQRENHPKIKVSDESGDKRVYGVLVRYDEDSNKPILASTGVGPIKVTGSCVGGDLLESNGDGTAKVQSDDIIRSKTIGKVTIGNSSASVKIVSCVLYCG